MLLCSGSVSGGTWQLSVAAVEVLAIPDKVLKQITLILGQQKVFGLLDDFSEVGDELSAFRGQF